MNPGGPLPNGHGGNVHSQPRVHENHDGPWAGHMDLQRNRQPWFSMSFSLCRRLLDTFQHFSTSFSLGRRILDAFLLFSMSFSRGRKHFGRIFAFFDVIFKRS